MERKPGSEGHAPQGVGTSGGADRHDAQPGPSRLYASEFVLGDTLSQLQLEWLASRLMRRSGVRSISFDSDGRNRLVVMHDVTGNWPLAVRDCLELLNVRVASTATLNAQTLADDADATSTRWVRGRDDNDRFAETGTLRRGTLTLGDETFRWAYDDTGVLEVWNWRVGRVCVDVGQADLELLARAAALALQDEQPAPGSE